MKIRVRNKVYLKEDFTYSQIANQYFKVIQLLKVIIPNYKRVYGTLDSYCIDCLEGDSFDDNLYHFIAGPGYVIKIKEIVNGIWMTREPRGVCYIYEPKSKPYRDRVEQEHPEWLTTDIT